MNDEIDGNILERYEIVELLGKGAYGIVWKVIHKKTKRVFALKKICQAFENARDCQRTYREVLYLDVFTEHENIVTLFAAVPDRLEKDLYLLLDFIETDLRNLIQANILQDNHKQYIAYQILKALKFLHSGEVIHRDIKPSNILVNQNCHVKVADFGLARSVIGLEDPENFFFTEYIASRWYRAPEILLGSTTYGKPVDIWAFGCVFAEILLGKVFFQGSSTLHQVEKIMEFTGEPSSIDVYALNSLIAPNVMATLNIPKQKLISSVFPNIDDGAVDLIRMILKFNPEQRLTVEEAMNHNYFKNIRDRDKDNDLVFKTPVNLLLSDDRLFPPKEYIREITQIKKNSKIKDPAYGDILRKESYFKTPVDSRFGTMQSNPQDIQTPETKKNTVTPSNSKVQSLLQATLLAQQQVPKQDKLIAKSILGKSSKTIKN